MYPPSLGGAGERRRGGESGRVATRSRAPRSQALPRGDSWPSRGGRPDRDDHPGQATQQQAALPDHREGARGPGEDEEGQAAVARGRIEKPGSFPTHLVVLCARRIWAAWAGARSQRRAKRNTWVAAEPAVAASGVQRPRTIYGEDGELRRDSNENRARLDLQEPAGASLQDTVRHSEADQQRCAGPRALLGAEALEGDGHAVEGGEEEDGARAEKRETIENGLDAPVTGAAKRGRGDRAGVRKHAAWTRRDGRSQEGELHCGLPNGGRRGNEADRQGLARPTAGRL